MYRERKTLAFLLVGLSFLSLLMVRPTPSGQNGGSSSQYDQGQAQGTISYLGYGKVSIMGTMDVRTLPRQTANAPLSVVSSQSLATFSIGFNGLNSTQSGNTGPPDVHVATGPNYVMEMVNDLGAIYTKQGSLYQTVNLYSLFNTIGVTDPKILFDSNSNRWFASIFSDKTNTFASGNVTIAVSTTADPFVWNLYNLCPGNSGICPSSLFPDQPILGVSDDKVTVSANVFHHGGGLLIGGQYWVLNKSEMVSGARTVDFFTHGPDSSFASLHPVQSLSSTTTSYIITVGENSTELNYCNACNNRVVISLTGVPPGPVSNQTVSLGIPPINAPPNTVQKGNFTGYGTQQIYIDNQDTRVQTAIWAQGMLWFALNDGCTPPGDSQRACIRFIELNTSTMSLAQNFDFGANGKYYFYPALSLDKGGNLDVVYGFSSANDYPSLAITGRLVSDLPNTLAAPVTIRSGTTYNAMFCAQPIYPNGPWYCRYGDYFGAAPDPSSPSNVWVAGQYSNNPNKWATFIVEMQMQGFTLSINPSSVSLACNRFGCDPGSATSTLTATSVNGFAGTVSLTYTGSWGSVTGPATITVPAGGSSSATITATHGGGKANIYQWTITGQSGQITASTTLTIVYYYCANCV